MACASQDVVGLGALPDFPADQVQEGWLEAGVVPGHLYRCGGCTLRFRWPMPPSHALVRQYETLQSDGRWDYGERPVWRRLRHQIESAPQRTVLDVGCYRGDFLHWLGPGWAKFGVEPSTGARVVAAQRGIELVASSIEEIPPAAGPFAAITLVDVMEHLPSPLEALGRLAALLAPGGRLVIYTGSTDALSWRLGGRWYWYVTLPEHVTFFSPRWFEWAAPQVACRVASVERSSHDPAPWATRADQALKNCLFFLERRLATSKSLQPLTRLPLLRRVARWRMAWWTAARDHVLVTLAKHA